MVPSESPPRSKSRLRLLRRWFVHNLGVHQARKEEIYCDLLQSVTLQDVSYWLQVLFSAGIATLGLVLNSPAVIIGAMLISPLMGPILANGLAFAVGDVVLAVRAIVSLGLSCSIAIIFAWILIALMPFKEITTEIQARISPNLLDLLVALFSGALGAVMTSKQAKGVATSIPGVAIAVALMPPLCVVGYGMGLAVSLDFITGLKTAFGGGLLFITNLTAITLTAMLVFLLLNMGTGAITAQARKWHQEDPESAWIQSLIGQLPITQKLRTIGSLRSRLMIISIPILVLLIPLSQSLARLQQQITAKQTENRVLRAAQSLWQSNFDVLAEGRPRSFIGSLASSVSPEGQLALQMTVFTSKSYSEAEKKQFQTQLAQKLNRTADDITLTLIEIPTTTNELIVQKSEQSAVTALPSPQPLTVSETQSAFLQTVSGALQSLALPPPAALLDYDVAVRADQSLTLNLAYLSPRNISADAQAVMESEVRNRLAVPNARVRLTRIPSRPNFIGFEPSRGVLPPQSQLILDQVGRWMQQYPTLQLALQAEVESTVLPAIQAGQPLPLVQTRYQSIAAYLTTVWQISGDRLQLDSTPKIAADQQPKVNLAFTADPEFLKFNFTSPDLVSPGLLNPEPTVPTP